MELNRLKREILHRHADELEAVLGSEKMLEADSATTVARFHELVTMQVCGDEPDDEMRYRCESSALTDKGRVRASATHALSSHSSVFGVRVCVPVCATSKRSDYLRAHSLTSLGDGIERPVLFICSKDDPVYSFKEVSAPLRSLI